MSTDRCRRKAAQRTERAIIHAAIGTAIFLSVTACGDAGSRPLVTVRDSGGVEIVESDGPAWDSAWEIDVSPIIDLASSGDEGAAHEFVYVKDAARLSDGAFVIAESGSREIRVFSVNGAHRHTIGREGEGPGEFRDLTQVIALPGDSIFAYDFMLSRGTVFGPDGSLSRVITLTGTHQSFPVFPIASGGFVIRAFDHAAPRSRLGLRRTTSPILRAGNAGQVTDTIAVIPGHESVVYDGGDSGALWGKQGHLATDGERVYLGWSDSLEYQVWSPEGDLLRIVRVPGVNLTLTPKQVEAEIRAYMPDPGKASPARRAIMEVQPDRTHRPAYRDMVVDAEGYVWLQEHQGVHERSADTRWFIFHPNGTWLGSIVMPARLTIFRIGKDWVLGKRLDEWDVEHVELYRLTRRH
jgi:hypothetical protein